MVENNEMPIEDFKLAFQVIEKITKELHLKNNFIFNLNYKEYLEN